MKMKKLKTREIVALLESNKIYCSLRGNREQYLDKAIAQVTCAIGYCVIEGSNTDVLLQLRKQLVAQY